MGVNPKLPPDQQKLVLLRQISDSLQSISSNISHEMEPFKVRPLVNPSDDMSKQWEKNKEENRKEIEIKELKRVIRDITSTSNNFVANFGKSTKTVRL